MVNLSLDAAGIWNLKDKSAKLGLSLFFVLKLGSVLQIHSWFLSFIGSYHLLTAAKIPSNSFG